jgi:HK97 family phage prohead protease
MSRSPPPYASTEALDSQGEIIKREAVEAALPAYMRFANIREMHQPSAVGVAKHADIDDKGLYLAAKVVDEDAWAKVKEGVYKGFSIGGHVVARDPADRSVITGIDLSEISLVDRPANPEAVIDLYKRSAGTAEEVGARYSENDQERVQRVHDTAVELGAHCGEGETVAEGDEAQGSGEVAKRDAMLAKMDALSAEVMTLARTVREQGALLRRLAEEPAPPKYLVEARTVEKRGDRAESAEEDEAPKTALDAIRKSHRHPIRLGLR